MRKAPTHLTQNFSTQYTTSARLPSSTIFSRLSQMRFSMTNHPDRDSGNTLPSLGIGRGRVDFTRRLRMAEGRLMISRKSGESLRIISGEHTTIITLTMDGTRMRVSIQAPKAVKIYREELIIKPKALEGAI